MRDRTRQGDQPVEPFADFLHQCEGAEDAGMAACASSNRDQPGSALLDRLAGEAVVDHVVQGDSAPAFDRAEDFLTRAQRGDYHRHLPLGAGRHVGVEPVVRLVDDLIDRKGRGRPVGIVAIMRGQFLGYLMQPFVDLALRPCIECRKAADDARLALRNDQFGTRHDEQRGSDDGQAQSVERCGQGHDSRVPLSMDVTRAYGPSQDLSSVTLRKRQADAAGRSRRCSIS